MGRSNVIRIFNPTKERYMKNIGQFCLTLGLTDRKLPKKSWVKISQIRTLSVKRIGKTVARASAEELVSVIDGLNEIIGS